MQTLRARRFLAASCLVLANAAAGADVKVTITDAQTGHVHPAGAPVAVQVTLTDPGVPGARLFATWVGPRGEALNGPFELAPGTHALQSPGSEVGYYGLVFTSDHPQVAFPPQKAGHPSGEYGFAILEERAPERALDPTSMFGVVHGNPADPRIGCGLKTLTWNSTGAQWWAQEIAERRAAGLEELPLVNGDGWDSDDAQPIPEWRLDEIAQKFRAYVEAEPTVTAWELGVEENLGGHYAEPYYFANLAAKAARLRAVADSVQPGIRFVYQFEGFDHAELKQVLGSGALAEFQVLSIHPYRWKDFPEPEEWMGEHVRRVRSILKQYGRGDMDLWITEVGLPVRGTTDPKGFFGYPAKKKYVPGATREHQARHIVKVHAIAAERRIERVFTYNYQNRGNDVDYAEHHFGMRSYTGDKTVMGHPLPSYVAYATMVERLEGLEFAGSSRPRPEAWVFEFAPPDPSGPSGQAAPGAGAGGGAERILAWASPGAQVMVQLEELRPGLQAGQVSEVVDMYGTPVPSYGSQVLLSDRPVYLTVERAPQPEFCYQYRRNTLLVDFQDHTAGDVAELEWDFGDGHTSSEREPMHVYSKPGIYTVELVVRDPSGVERAASRTVRVKAPSRPARARQFIER